MKKYTFCRFALDLLLIWVTGGLWLIWMIFSFLRNGHIERGF